MARQSDYFEAFLRDEPTHFVNSVVERVVDQVVERLTEWLERSERSERSTAEGQQSCAIPAMTDTKAAVLQRLQVIQAEGLSLQAIANRLNNEVVLTLSGKGRWQKGTRHLLA